MSVDPNDTGFGVPDLIAIPPEDTTPEEPDFPGEETDPEAPEPVQADAVATIEETD
jgi:hypothetical protein